MSVGVKVKEGENVESAIRRFKRTVEKAGIPKELRKREYHQKNSTIKKRRVAAAKKRHAKKLAREKQMFDDNAKGKGKDRR